MEACSKGPCPRYGEFLKVLPVSLILILIPQTLPRKKRPPTLLLIQRPIHLV